MAVDWAKLLTVDACTATQLFVTHPPLLTAKLRIRGHTLQFTGTQQRAEALMKCLRRQLLKYVFPERDRPEDIDWVEARNKFGDNDPESDGKLGEMLLYFFVEAYLKTPLMAYKLRDLSNPNDQVKGADGVFVGEYDGQQSLLIGESKIHQTFASAISSTLDSLHRFHERSAPFNNELMIARKYPPERGLSDDVLSTVFELMSDSATRPLVHPVFISYDYEQIAQISGQAVNAATAEAALAKAIVVEMQAWSTAIDGLRTKYGKPYQVYLDFFILPVENCLTLRNEFYEMLHGHPYISAAVKATEKRLAKEVKAAKHGKDGKSKPPVAKALKGKGK